MSDPQAGHEGSRSEAVAALVASHRDFLAFVERRVRDKALAEDLVQEAFAKSLSTVDSVENLESIRAWFYRSLRNAIVDQHRRDASSTR
jgi:RNA polymerase sigma factor (sigma-70 family)